VACRSGVERLLVCESRLADRKIVKESPWTGLVANGTRRNVEQQSSHAGKKEEVDWRLGTLRYC
jgi:hypothetical protein